MNNLNKKLDENLINLKNEFEVLTSELPKKFVIELGFKLDILFT
jgi:hypothetical protein